MKKNLITVLIFALCLINLVFNILLVFVFMPSTTKTNKLITDIAKVLDLELESQKKGDSSVVNVDDLSAFKLEQGNPINLAADGSDKTHVLQYGVTINLNSKASDYSKVSENLAASTDIVYDMTRDIIGKYTYAEATDVEVQRQIKEEILKALQETFKTECIYSVSFYNWVAQ